MMTNTMTNQNPLTRLLQFTDTIPGLAAGLVEGPASHREEQFDAIKTAYAAVKAFSVFLDTMNHIPPTELAERAAAQEAVHTLNDAIKPIISYRMYATRLSMATYTWDALNYIQQPKRRATPQGGGASTQRIQVAAAPI